MLAASVNSSKSFNKAIDIKPDFHKAWFTLGTSYEADNNLDSAIVKYSSAIEISPGYTKAYGNLGNVYRLKEDYISAKDILMTVIQIDPTFSKGYYNYYFASRLDLEDPVRSNLRDDSGEVVIGGFGTMSGETVTFKVTN